MKVSIFMNSTHLCYLSSMIYGDIKKRGIDLDESGCLCTIYDRLKRGGNTLDLSKNEGYGNLEYAIAHLHDTKLKKDCIGKAKEIVEANPQIKFCIFSYHEGVEEGIGEQKNVVYLNY
ncbi:MAG: hypothetical protein KKA64_02860, partial [Nanoarchaeota archaeon]|nr:hypothetical protein [Nanoarchaeota archaeon]